MDVKISASDVKKLRDQTGAGMMDCKKALTEAGGDFEGAIELLRKKGQKMMAKRADREAKEGVVIALTSDDSTKGIIVKVSCETDFVSKNEDFVNFGKTIANAALENFPATLEDMLKVEIDGHTVADQTVNKTGVIGEKVELVSYERLEGAMVVPYIHMGYKAAVLVQLSKDGDFIVPGKDVAMQVAAMKPMALDKDGVDSAVIEKEIEIGKEQARAEGKPEAMLEKIAMGKLNKFYKENTLVNQIFVKDNKKTVSQYLQGFDNDLAAVAFKHVTLK